MRRSECGVIPRSGEGRWLSRRCSLKGDAVPTRPWGRVHPPGPTMSSSLSARDFLSLLVRCSPLSGAASVEREGLDPHSGRGKVTHEPELTTAAALPLLILAGWLRSFAPMARSRRGRRRVVPGASSIGCDAATPRFAPRSPTRIRGSCWWSPSSPPRRRTRTSTGWRRLCSSDTRHPMTWPMPTPKRWSASCTRPASTGRRASRSSPSPPTS